MRRSVVLLTLLLAGCSTAQPPAPPAEAPFGSFPAPPVVLRSASFDPAELEKGGAEFEAGLSNQLVSADGSEAQLSPSWAGEADLGGLAYAMYRFAVEDYAGPASLDLLWKDGRPATGDAWVGLAQSGSERWDWHQPDANGRIEVPSFAPYLYQPQGELLAVVVLLGEAPQRLFGLQVGPPHDDSGLPLDEISLPAGFSINVYAYPVNNARGMTWGEEGTLFVGSRNAGNVYALRDYNADGVADELDIVANGHAQPVGVAFRDGELYFSAISEIFKLPGIEAQLDAPPDPQQVSAAFPTDASHGWKFIAFGPDGKLYVPVGAPCNICDAGAPYSMIHRMDADGSNLEVVARGMRNTVGFDWHPQTGELWWTDNGRDHMGDDIPPDELNRVPAGSLTGETQAPHFGYPHWHGADVPDPGFGGGHSADEFVLPEQELGPHVASLGMRFYTGATFPELYHGAIFIAEHGSWNRTEPLGARIALVRLDGAGNSQGYEIFAEGWQREDGSRWGRPADVLVAPDGSLLVSDDHAGAIYRISYDGG